MEYIKVYFLVNKHIHILYHLFFFAVFIFTEIRGTVLFVKHKETYIS